MSATHGGDLEATAVRYGVDASSLTDFSANIAPGGPPPGVARALRAFIDDPRRLAPYPGADYCELREEIARMHDVEPECVVVGHGGPALLDLALRVSDAAAWLVPVPAFSEYRRAIDAARRTMRRFALPRSMQLDIAAFVERLGEAAGGALINTPHNPSGVPIRREDALALLAWCDSMGRSLLIDEAFIDYEPAHSIAPEAIRTPRTIVLRSLTKFYALAGVRVAYALAHPDLARAMRSAGPSWPVGSLDAAIALAALRDENYALRTREENARARADLRAALEQAGMAVTPSAANFLLVELPASLACFDAVLRALINEGIVVRDCRSYDGLEQRSVIRVAVLDRERNHRLVRALSRALTARLQTCARASDIP